MNTQLLVAGALLGVIVNSNSEAMNFWSGMFNAAPIPVEEEVQRDPVEEAVEHLTERIRHAQMRMIAWELELLTLVHTNEALRAILSRRDQRGRPALRDSEIPDTVRHIEGMIRSCDTEVFCCRDVLRMITEDNGKKYLEKLGTTKKVRLNDGTEREETYSMYEVIDEMYLEVVSYCRLWRENVYVSVINRLNGTPIGGPNMVRELNEGDEHYRRLYALSPLKPTER